MNFNEINKDFIITELERAEVFYKIVGNEVMIACPFHSEVQPSMGISLDESNNVPPGVFHCFGCDESGHWNKLAKVLGVQAIDSKTKSKTKYKLSNPFLSKRKMFDKIVKKQSTEKVVDIFFDLYVWRNAWRGLSKNFLQRFRPARMFDDNWKEWRLFFPIYRLQPILQVRKKDDLAGYITERIYGTKSPKHLFSKNFPVKELLYPINLHRSNKVVLVEGLFDAIRLQKFDIPSLCFFGTSNWSKYKITLLRELGINHIVICGDGDIAGWKVNKEIYSSVLNKFKTVKIFNIPNRSYLLKNYSKENLIKYIKNNKLYSIDIGLEKDKLLEEISKKVDRYSYDPGNMPIFLIKQLKKLLL